MKRLFLTAPLLACAALAQGVPEKVFFQGMTYDYVVREVGSRAIKGAPYSADAVTEITQSLSDGNRIHRTLSSRLVRDSQGRTRREQALEPLGNAAPGEQPPRVTTIDDPVAGESYVLNAREHTARKMFVARAGAFADKLAAEKRTFAFTYAPGAPNAEAKFMVRQDAKEESLGTQVIEGLAAQGTRTTMTIPAGQVGNERPIEVVDERWYSPDLQTVIMTRHSDPRSGEVVYRLTNIDRGEPDPTLFHVPADYRVIEAK